jgi:hypothetical protein
MKPPEIFTMRGYGMVVAVTFDAINQGYASWLRLMTGSMRMSIDPNLMEQKLTGGQE